jgi:predicted ATPase
LANDGSDLAAAIATIQEIGDNKAVDESVADAFPGSEVQVANDATHAATWDLARPGCSGIVRWHVAVFAVDCCASDAQTEHSWDAGWFQVHSIPDLLPALGRLIVRAAESTQVVVVTHAEKLIAQLAEIESCNSIQLEKKFGETSVLGTTAVNRLSWQWPAR